MHLRCFILFQILITGFPVRAWLQNASTPFVDSLTVFGNTKGAIVVEAEHFYKQTQTSKRAWYINSPHHHPQVWPDHDTATWKDAGGLAYVEALPDLFHTDEDPIIEGDNLGSAGGSVAVLHYRVFFPSAGRYYVWTRLRSNDEEDNTTAAGFDNTWPATTKTLQSPVNKKQWIWKSDNRISRNPWKIGRAAFDIPEAGVHDVQFSMREDGEEFDRFLITADSNFNLQGELGPAETVYRGKAIRPFTGSAPSALPYHNIINPDESVYGANVMYADTMNAIAFEAENFYRQTKAGERMWHLVTATLKPTIGPDSDPPHLHNASGNAYLELLPDVRQKDEDAAHSKTSIMGVGGRTALLSYMVNFPAAGKYFVWISGLNTDGDDNTLHVGINDNWPESGKKMMFQSKTWRWSNTQRDTRKPITIDVPAKGRHEFMISMREDGCEIDRILLTADSNFKPTEQTIYPVKISKGNIAHWEGSREKQMNTASYFVATEKDLIIETESVPASEGWRYVVDSSGHSGLGYYEWIKPGQGIRPGEGLLTYTFEITTGGNYQFLIRGKMKDANNRMETPDPDGNDVWVQFEGASTCNSHAALKGGWNKVAILGHPAGWTLNTNLDIAANHAITTVCLSYKPGIYSITLSGRSAGYAIDKIILRKTTSGMVTNFNSSVLQQYHLAPSSPQRRRR